MPRWGTELVEDQAILLERRALLQPLHGGILFGYGLLVTPNSARLVKFRVTDEGLLSSPICGIQHNDAVSHVDGTGYINFPRDGARL